MKKENSLTDYKIYKGAWIYSGNLFKMQKLTRDQVLQLLKGGNFVRHTFDFDIKQNTSFWYVIKDSFGGMDELSSKMRNQIKKCFKTMRVEKISKDYMLANGYEVFCRACESYRIKSLAPSKEQFEQRIINSVENEYWGVIDIATEKLVAFSMNVVTDEYCDYSTMKAIPEFQKLYAYYGLIYEMNRYYLAVRKLNYVNDGARSITNHSNIQPFLINKFKFRKAYCHLEITYKGWLGFVVNLLYPFRNFIHNHQVCALLNLEAMNKSEI